MNHVGKGYFVLLFSLLLLLHIGQKAFDATWVLCPSSQELGPNEQWLAFKQQAHGPGYTQIHLDKNLITSNLSSAPTCVLEPCQSRRVLRAVWTNELGLLEQQLVPLVCLQISWYAPYPVLTPQFSSPGDYLNYSDFISFPCLKQPCFNAEIIECGRNHFHEIRNTTKISYTCELVLVFYIPTFFFKCATGTVESNSVLCSEYVLWTCAPETFLNKSVHRKPMMFSHFFLPSCCRNFTDATKMDRI